MNHLGPSGDALILVADDDEDILNLVSFRLRQVGYEVVPASNGAEAIERALERRPDLCVFDIQMPEMNGYDAIAALRADERTRETPVIMLTASVEEKDVARGFELGADDYMRKPFNPRELQARVEALLKARSR